MLPTVSRGPHSSLVENMAMPLAMNTMPMTSAYPTDPMKRTQQPIVTGTSVLGIKYKDGVMLAADTLASYGSLARFKDVTRIKTVGDSTLIGAGGEMSDFQTIMEMMEKLDREDLNADDGYRRSPEELFAFLRANMYHRRNKFDPLWNAIVMAGYNKGKPFLGTCDLIGTAYEENIIATGFGSYLAIPILRRRWKPDLEEGEARALLEDCLRVLFYRDCRAINKINIAKATEEGVTVSEPYVIDTNWNLASFCVPKADMDTDGSW